MRMVVASILLMSTLVANAENDVKSANTLPKANSPDLIGKWCGAYGEGWKKGDGPLEWGRCTKSALKGLLDAEGYAYVLTITDKSITINGQKCQRIGTSKWSSGYILKLKCPKGEETWRVSITGKKLEQTLTTDGAEP
jgi:hypothetical protein